MRCDTERLTRHALEMLEEADARAVEAHAAECRECAQRLAELRRTVGLFEELPAATPRPVDVRRVREAAAGRVRRTALAARAWAWIVPRRRGAWALAAAAGLFVLCFHYGVAIRVGAVELAFGGPAREAPVSTAPAVPDAGRIEAIARRESVRELLPTILDLAQKINELDARQREALVGLRREMLLQQATHQDEMRRGLRFIADGMAGVPRRPVRPADVSVE